MKKEPGFIYRIFLIIGDLLAIVFAFSFAYYYRVYFDPRPYTFSPDIWDFFFKNLFLLPAWLVVLATLGTYTTRNLQRPLVLVGRLFLASIVGVMMIISYDFFVNDTAVAVRSLFPVRSVAFLVMLFSFVAFLIERLAIYFVRRTILRHNIGLIRTVVVGNSANTTQLLTGVWPETGFKIVGVVAKDKYVPEEWRKRQYSDVNDALRRLRADAIIHTDRDNIEEVNTAAINHHALYYYSPSLDSVITHSGRVQWLGATPIMLIRTTPLHGAALVLKRTIDIIVSLFGIIVASPFMLVIFIIQKIVEPKAPAIYKDVRMTRFERKFNLYKFRSMRQEYCGMSGEEAFTKMGRPDLVKAYRKQDSIKNDPRITKWGSILRKTSLDELPQLFNILKGDISFIGPRALPVVEIESRKDKAIILSVKSGLTGLAQVSGRRDISFEERRVIDVYYVKNWSLAMDISIFFRTIISVLKHEGAK
ncbi:sugar transferase [Candidatus Saccharibacteria bacterium]|nr:sugar transferase [Candidatus Saccharibacteria bacterium]